MAASRPKRLRCAVYTRKSSEEGLDQAFNSLDAQREACEAYIKSQAGEGWQPVRTRYDDGGLSGGTLERPALQRLLADIEGRKIDTVVVYKVDRLTRSLADFAKIVEVFDAHGVSFVSVTQQFNTTTSMGRLTLNMLLSFAQFEREVTGERIRDKIAASKQKGMWMGGFVPLGYEARDRSLVINEVEAETVRRVFRLYLEHGSVRRVKEEADRMGLTTKVRQAGGGRMRGGRPLSRGYIYKLLKNPLYAGRIAHKGESHKGQHEAIIDAETWHAVQARLAGDAGDRRSRARVTEPSLLAGLLHDERGNRLSPSYAVKNGLRYRYYVSQATLQHRDSDAGSVVRIPAREIEGLVWAQIASLLRNPARMIDEVGEPYAARDQKRLLAAARKYADSWAKVSAVERRTFLLLVVSGVTVTEGEVVIVLRRTALTRTLLGDARSTCGDKPTPIESIPDVPRDELTVTIRVQLKLCSCEMQLVTPPGNAIEMFRRPDTALIQALMRAHKWKHKLFRGEAPSIQAIANEEGVTQRYVTRIMRLAFLAPDIVEAILEGRQPPSLDLERLRYGISLAWTEQRRLFRFEER